MFQLRCLAEKMCVGVEGEGWIVEVIAVTLRAPEHQEYIVYIIQEYKSCYKKLIINHRIENVWKLLLSTTPDRGAPFLMLRF